MDIEMLKVPPLIIQPYAENAIRHGLDAQRRHSATST
jgi:sensor histidine kinase YesM